MITGRMIANLKLTVTVAKNNILTLASEKIFFKNDLIMTIGITYNLDE